MTDKTELRPELIEQARAKMQPLRGVSFEVTAKFSMQELADLPDEQRNAVMCGMAQIVSASHGK